MAFNTQMVSFGWFGATPIRGNHQCWSIWCYLMLVKFPWSSHRKYLLVVFRLPLWKMMEFVSWDDELFPVYGKIFQMFQTTNQIIMVNYKKWWFSPWYSHKKSIGFITSYPSPKSSSKSLPLPQRRNLLQRHRRRLLGEAPRPGPGDRATRGRHRRRRRGAAEGTGGFAKVRVTEEDQLGAVFP